MLLCSKFHPILPKNKVNCNFLPTEPFESFFKPSMGSVFFIEEIIELIKKFRDDRDWQQFHDSKNLAISLNVESSELLELFLWKESNEADSEKIKSELADVFYNALLIADNYGFDIKDIIIEKLKQNEGYGLEFLGLYNQLIYL